MSLAEDVECNGFKNTCVTYMVDPILRLKKTIGVNWAEHVEICSQLIFSSLKAYEKVLLDKGSIFHRSHINQQASADVSPTAKRLY